MTVAIVTWWLQMLSTALLPTIAIVYAAAGQRARLRRWLAGCLAVSMAGGVAALASLAGAAAVFGPLLLAGPPAPGVTDPDLARAFTRTLLAWLEVGLVLGLVTAIAGQVPRGASRTALWTPVARTTAAPPPGPIAWRGARALLAATTAVLVLAWAAAALDGEAGLAASILGSVVVVLSFLLGALARWPESATSHAWLSGLLVAAFLLLVVALRPLGPSAGPAVALEEVLLAASVAIVSARLGAVFCSPLPPERPSRPGGSVRRLVGWFWAGLVCGVLLPLLPLWWLRNQVDVAALAVAIALLVATGHSEARALLHRDSPTVHLRPGPDLVLRPEFHYDRRAALSRLGRGALVGWAHMALLVFLVGYVLELQGVLPDLGLEAWQAGIVLAITATLGAVPVGLAVGVYYAVGQYVVGGLDRLPEQAFGRVAIGAGIAGPALGGIALLLTRP